jgi:hypothetical protein
VHAPSFVAPSAFAQTLQEPSHDESQQTPSTQEPEEHSSVREQVAPWTRFGRQVRPLLQ